MKIRYLALAALIAFNGQAQAAVVALFADTSYVDYSPGSSGSEASNLQATLESQGHTVNTFTGVTTSDWIAALVGVELVAIPEQENGAIFPALEAGAVTAIQSFVTSGGGLIISDDYRGFLDGVFGYALAQSGSAPYDLVVANAAGTSFEGGPSSLPGPSATNSWTAASLPAGSLCMYENGASDCALYVVSYGAGSITSIGWDWFSAAPVGSVDGGWLAGLDSAVAFVAGAGSTGSTGPATPVPTMPLYGIVLTSLGLLLVATRRIRKPTKRG